MSSVAGLERLLLQALLTVHVVWEISAWSTGIKLSKQNQNDAK